LSSSSPPSSSSSSSSSSSLLLLLLYYYFVVVFEILYFLHINFLFIIIIIINYNIFQMEVPSHLCCEDPSWLYHIFQDTYVSVSAVLDLILSALQETSAIWARTNSSFPSVTLPGPPTNVQCRVKRKEASEENLHATHTVNEKFTENQNVLKTGRPVPANQGDSRMLDGEASGKHSIDLNDRGVAGEKESSDATESILAKKDSSDPKKSVLHSMQSLEISWTPPWDVDFFLTRNLSYKILLEDSNSGKISSFTVSSSVVQYTVGEGVEEGGRWGVWVGCKMGGVPCPFAGYAECL
jgi:hypothetical protein